jgi:alpha-glucosidase (family GH31 glycosyl hydrolase)
LKCSNYYCDSINRYEILYWYFETTEIDKLFSVQVLEGTLGKNLPPGAPPYDCYPEDYNVKPENKNRSCLGWKDKAELRLVYKHTPNHVNCYKFSWSIFDDNFYPYDCFQLGDAHWYGGILANKAPFHERVFAKTPLFVETTNGINGLGSVVEPFWLTSKSVGIIVEGNPPLSFSVNNNGSREFCLFSQYENTPYHNYKKEKPNLNYTICSGENMAVLHQYIMERFYPTPSKQAPQEDLFKLPIYSSWGHFKQNINQDKILSYVNSLNDQGLEKGLVLLQEGWEYKHGDIEFDHIRFPNASGMVDVIQQMGFQVGITVSHMVAPDSDRFQQGITEDFLVMDAGIKICTFSTKNSIFLMKYI